MRCYWLLLAGKIYQGGITTNARDMKKNIIRDYKIVYFLLEIGLDMVLHIVWWGWTGGREGYRLYISIHIHILDWNRTGKQKLSIQMVFVSACAVTCCASAKAAGCAGWLR